MKLRRPVFTQTVRAASPFGQSRSQSSFNLDVVLKNYEQRTEFSAANYRKTGKPFRMILPPPNVTGKLHLGHALTVAVEDAICRNKRIHGSAAEWLPGFDHAGIATQAVVEKELMKREGLARSDMTRDEFVKKCEQWSTSSSDSIRQQLTRMGASLKWDDCYYTLDEKFSAAVSRAFCILHDDGAVFRGKRMVNWCPSLASTLSDQEVNYVEVPSDGFLSVPFARNSKKRGTRKVKVGTMYKIRYELSDGSGFVEVATTRPETMFADVALAVHPDDDRYSKLIGKYANSPVVPGRRMIILADSGVLKDKGTGVLKITPAHDPLDFAIAQRNIEKIEESIQNLRCIDDNGMMYDIDEQLNGLDRFEAREHVVRRLTDNGALLGVIPHPKAQISVCSRTGDIIEPFLKEQWFLDVNELHENASAAIRSGMINVSPSYQTHRLLEWLDNKEPWCLSRQLVWGHRIPAFRTTESSEWTIAESARLAAEKLGLSDGKGLMQDEDVLDTWFSSSLVPLVSDGWMNKDWKPSTAPVDVLDTGWDISGFWVARMIAMNIRLSGQVPFGQVVLHGLVRDGEGRKMSKSLGNVIDPLDVLDGIGKEDMCSRLKESNLQQNEIEKACADIEKRFPNGIPRCGPDALRYALLKYDILSSDIPLDVASSATEGLHFCNKLWNLAAYYEQVAEKSGERKDVDSERVVDEWLLSRLSATLTAVDDHFKNHALHLALNKIQSFIVADVCDVYLETSKRALWSGDVARLRQVRSTLQRVMQPTLVQLSAFMPFVCEHLYEQMFRREYGSVHFDVVKPSLFIFHKNDEIESAMNLMLAAVAATRSLRQRLQIGSKIVFEGIIELDKDIDGSEYLETDLANDVGPIAGLLIKDVVSSGRSKENSFEGYLPAPVPGHDAKLWLKIEDTCRDEFVSSLRKQLEKTQTRQKQFAAKCKSYEDMVRDGRDTMKPVALSKCQRKADQARQVAENALEEAKRIEKIIEQY